VAQAVALQYITLRSAQVRQLIAQDNLDSQLETLQIARWRNQAGLIGAVEVEQALVTDTAYQTAFVSHHTDGFQQNADDHLNSSANRRVCSF
jgi:hypothetical protein